MTDSEKSVAYGQLAFLKYRFEQKINNEDYFLEYSGGKDSHLLYWFIKEFCKWDNITIVGVNTSFEIPEIRDRIIQNSDVVLFPKKNRWEIKEKYGIPCFTKQQDEYIDRYQKGSRSQNTMNAILGLNPKMNLNKKARELTLSGKMHRCSRQCCVWNKEKPLNEWGKQNNKKPIMGVRGSESATRKAQYTTCLTKKGVFTPLYDVTDEMVDLIYRVYEIPIPKVYNYLTRTGCAGCPYGRHIETELSLIPKNQRLQTIKYFKESYDVLGVNYDNLQMTLDLM